jgi:hypothetical protein
MCSSVQLLALVAAYAFCLFAFTATCNQQKGCHLYLTGLQERRLHLLLRGGHYIGAAALMRAAFTLALGKVPQDVQ